MASKPSLFVRILLAVIHKIWAALFFLTSLSALSLANHYWTFILDSYHKLEAWVLAGMEYINTSL